MSEGEIFVFIFSIILSIGIWIHWYYVSIFAINLRKDFTSRFPLIISPVISAGILYFVLKKYSSFDVKSDPKYILFYFFMGLAWISVLVKFLPFAGLSYWHDGIARNNSAASIVAAAAVIAIGLCFTGGNIGNGPGWWVVVYCAALASGTLFLILILLSLFTDLADILTIERDKATALRIAFFLIAIGLIFGRAVAGDWISAEQTIFDFKKIARFAIFFVIAEAMMLLLFKPNPNRQKLPVFIFGVIPSAIYICAAVFFLTRLGLWDIFTEMPK